MLLPKTEKIYSYWIYICPMDAPFSRKVAVYNLRNKVRRGVEPWGEIKMNDDDPVMIQLLKSVMSEDKLTSRVPRMAFDIMITMWIAEAKKQKASTDMQAICIYKDL